VFIDFVARRALARMPSSCGVAVAFGFNGSLSAPPAGPSSFRTSIALLMYADDMALTCASPEELVAFLHAMDEACAECGLCINAAKTEVMAVTRGGAAPLPADITLRGGPVKQVSRFKYLGSLVASDCSLDAEISARIGRAAAAFQGLRHVWAAPNRQFGAGLKAVVYKTCVLPILLFGSECWALPDGLAHRLGVFHNNCLRSILGVRRSDRHSLDHIYSRCNAAPLSAHLAVSRLRQLGHVTRMTHIRLPKLALWNAPPGPRFEGRPRIRWSDLARRDCAAIGITPVHLDDCCADRSFWRRSFLTLLPRKREG
jgi:hypothetical protein